MAYAKYIEEVLLKNSYKRGRFEMEIVLTIIVIIIIYVLITYNSFVSKNNKIKQALSGIDVYLTQRFDLIPNLVECVKGYTQYEEATLTKIAQMRANYYNNKNLKDGEILNNECNKLIAIAENNPNLKANEQFLNLQKNLSKMESQLQAARRIYNSEVNAYNNAIQIFPNSLLAKIFNFKEKEFFAAEDNAKNNIFVD